MGLFETFCKIQGGSWDYCQTEVGKWKSSFEIWMMKSFKSQNGI